MKIQGLGSTCNTQPVRLLHQALARALGMLRLTMIEWVHWFLSIAEMTSHPMSKFKVKMAITITIITYMALLTVQRPNVMTCHDFTVRSSIEKCRQALGIGSLSFEQLSCKLDIMMHYVRVAHMPHTQCLPNTFHRVSMSFLVS